MVQKEQGTVLLSSSFLVSSQMVLVCARRYLSMECYCGIFVAHGTNKKKLLLQFLPESLIWNRNLNLAGSELTLTGIHLLVMYSVTDTCKSFTRRQKLQPIDCWTGIPVTARECKHSLNGNGAYITVTD